MTLSIDIGKKNLGWSLIKGNQLEDFGLFDIESNLKVKDTNMLGRNRVLIEWFNSFKDLTKLVIEKQVINNVVAMCIQSCLITLGLNNKIEVICYDPKNKFKNIKYDSKKKEHKKIIINMALEYLNDDDKLKLMSYSKKDDISDAIVQGFLNI